MRVGKSNKKYKKTWKSGVSIARVTTSKLDLVYAESFASSFKIYNQQLKEYSNKIVYDFDLFAKSLDNRYCGSHPTSLKMDDDSYSVVFPHYCEKLESSDRYEKHLFSRIVDSSKFVSFISPASKTKSDISGIYEELDALRAKLKDNASLKLLMRIKKLVMRLNALILSHFNRSIKHTRSLIRKLLSVVRTDARRRIRSNTGFIFKCYSDFSGCDDEEANTYRIVRISFLYNYNFKENEKENRINSGYRFNIRNCA